MSQVELVKLARDGVISNTVSATTDDETPSVGSYTRSPRSESIDNLDTTLSGSRPSREHVSLQRVFTE